MENHNKGRTILYMLGGGYLLYLAYDLFMSESAGENLVWSRIFSVFFLLMGIVILGFAVHNARKEITRNEDGEGNSEDKIESFESDIKDAEESLNEKKGENIM